MRIAILTINYNNFLGLKKTLDSVLGQRDCDLQHVVVDGGSNDGSVDLLSKVDDSRFTYVSEPDGGIFDAMNKALKMADSDYYIFLNSGDQFSSLSTLCDFTKNVSLSDFPECVKVIYGDCVIMPRGEKVRARSDVSVLRHGLSFASHQSMFFRDKFYYNSKLKVYGDLELLMRVHRKNGSEAFRRIDQVVSLYDSGGVSNKVSLRKRREKYFSIFMNYGFIECCRSAYVRLAG